MKFDCGVRYKPLSEKELRALERYMAAGDRWRAAHAHKAVWHRWFAWYPVRLTDHDCRWMEWVERRQEFYSGGTIWPMGLVRDTHYKPYCPAPISAVYKI